MSLTHGPSMVTSGLVLCVDAANIKSYPGSGTTCSDLSGNGNIGTLVNGVGYSSGSFVYDGVDDSITVPNSSSVAVTGDMSILAWVKVTNFSTYRSIVGKTASSSVPAPYDFYLQSGSGVPVLYRGNGTVNASQAATAAPSTGIWQHLAVTMTGTSVAHYLNGSANGSGTISTTIGNDATQSLYIGYRVDGVTKMLGNYGLLQIYNFGLTAAQITQNFNALRGRYGL